MGLDAPIAAPTLQGPGPVVRVPVLVAVAQPGHQHPGQPLVEGPLRERRHRQRLDMAVEGGVIVGEGLVVGQVAGPGPVEQRHHQARPIGGPAHPGGGLDVLGGGLGLADHDHRPQPGHVDAHRDHVGGQQQVHRTVPRPLRPGRIVDDEEAAQYSLDVVGRHSRGELFEIDRQPVGQAGGEPGPPELGAQLVLGHAPHPGQLPDRVEVADRGHPRIDPAGFGLEFVVHGLRGGHQRGEDPQLHLLEPLPVAADPDVHPPRRLVAGWCLFGEEGAMNVEHRRREHPQVSPEHRPGLLAGPPDGGGGGHHLGPHRSPPPAPGGQAVDGRLVQPGHGPERPGHQVHLVLEDEVGWPQPGYVCRLGRREALGGDGGVGVALGPVLAVGAVEVGVAVAVALAAALDPAEQVGQRPVPRQLGELVDGGDHQGREQPVDLRVDGDDRYPLAGGAGRRERALPGLAAIHQEPGGGRVVLAVVAGVDRPPAPRAVAQLEGRGRGLPPLAAEALALHPLLGVFVLVGGDRTADPHPQPEGRAFVAAVALGPVSAQQFGRAHQRGCPLELLGGQQAQGVAHQHGHPVPPVHRVVAVAHHPLQAAHGHGVGHQAQVGLGLAAPGGEEQQVGQGGAGPPVGMAGVGQRRQA